MNDSLAGHCFRVYGSPRNWLRMWGWKSDVIYLVWKGGWDLVINFVIYLPASEATSQIIFGTEIHEREGVLQMSVDGLGLILGSDQSGIRYPSSLAPIS